MKSLTIKEAKEILGVNLFNKRNSLIIESRLNRLLDFSKKHKSCNIEILENNSWSSPPKKSTLKHYALIGGATYKYQLWAVIK